MSDRTDTTTTRRPKTPPLLPDQRDELARKKEEENESTGIEGVRQLLIDAHDSIGEALDRLDEIKAQAK